MSDKKKKLWGGRFAGETSSITERISSSIRFDSRLFRQDIRGSVAHAKMLNRIGVLSEQELGDIIRGLGEIEKEIEEGSFPFSESLEDIHMNIEGRLTERIGDAGRKLHTGRSRNDQIALDVRLYVMDESDIIEELLLGLIGVCVDTAEENIDVLLPGYTHLQVAQPVRLAHHLLVYAWQFLRDLERLGEARDAASCLPLGTGALAGVNYPSDREFLRKELGFDAIIQNSMDAVSDRDFVLDFLYFAAVLGTHLSRLSEELIIWSSTEFGYIRLDDSVTTGSSIMPQKRNPDIAELIRGKTGRLNGNLVSLLTMVKGLPLAYNRDFQEDKEPLFDSAETVKLALEGMTGMLATITINSDRMERAVFSNYSTATDLADYLVKKGMPFRKSHEVVGNIVLHCEETGADFFSLTGKDLARFSDLFGEDASGIVQPESSTERKLSPGSTARKEVLAQIGLIRKDLESGKRR